MLTVTRYCAIAAAALLASTADAHGRLGLPAPTFIASAQSKPNYWAYGVYAAKNPPAASYAGTQGEADLKKREQTFDTNFKKNGHTSLKKWIMANQVVGVYDGRPSGGSPECGFTDPNGKAQPLPAQIVWPSPTFQHPGPCEAWCDDEIVIPYQGSCNAYAKSGKMDYDKAKCEGKKMLTFYYMAVHVAEPFQVYANCVPLQGGGSGGTRTNTNTGGGGANTNTNTNTNAGGNANNGRNTNNGGNASNNNAGNSNMNNGRTNNNGGNNNNAGGNANNGRNTNARGNNNNNNNNNNGGRARSIEDEDVEYNTTSIDFGYLDN